jgi:exonuclease SbcD
MHKKSVTVVELSEKGSPVNISVIPLLPRHDMREIKGSYDELTLRKNYENTETEDYIHITLTDEDDIPNVFDKLRIIYKNALLLDYDNRRTRSSSFVADTADLEKSPLELFEELYEQQNNRPMSDEQQSITEELIREIWEVKE